jgi:hypothetical protein
MLSAVGPISPVPSEGGGSWVWILVAVGVVLGTLALTWLAGLWGNHRRDTKEEEVEQELPSHREQRAA